MWQSELFWSCTGISEGKGKILKIKMKMQHGAMNKPKDTEDVVAGDHNCILI